MRFIHWSQLLTSEINVVFHVPVLYHWEALPKYQWQAIVGSFLCLCLMCHSLYSKLVHIIVLKVSPCSLNPLLYVTGGFIRTVGTVNNVPFMSALTRLFTSVVKWLSGFISLCAHGLISINVKFINVIKQLVLVVVAQLLHPLDYWTHINQVWPSFAALPLVEPS